MAAVLALSHFGARAQAQVFPPTANNDTTSAAPATPTAIHVLANDSAGSFPIDPTSVELLSSPSQGSASVDPATGVVTYTSAPDTTGSVSFTYGVRDTQGNPSNIASVYVYVMNYPPQANGDMGAVSYLDSVVIPVLENDQGGSAPLDPSTLEIVTSPVRGSVAVDPDTGDVLYTPTGSAPGGDSFQYRVSNQFGLTSNIATVNVMVFNAPPQISNFRSSRHGNMWKFEGWVADEEPAACLVHLGQGLNVDVWPDANGYFVHVQQMPNVYGMVTAQATDPAGQQSQIASAMYYGY
jgi:hypothetical protein